MTDHDEVKNRFAQALKARQDENRAQFASKAEESERVLASIVARVDALRDGLDALGNPRNRISRRPFEVDDDGRHSVDILLARAGVSQVETITQTVTVRVALGANGTEQIRIDGLSGGAATVLARDTGSRPGDPMSVPLNCIGDVCDAIEATAVDYFGS